MGGNGSNVRAMRTELWEYGRGHSIDADLGGLVSDELFPRAHGVKAFEKAHFRPMYAQGEHGAPVHPSGISCSF